MVKKQAKEYSLSNYCRTNTGRDFHLQDSSSNGYCGHIKLGLNLRHRNCMDKKEKRGVRHINKIVVLFLYFYQKGISPYLISSCRFTPSCSEYAKQAFIKYSFFHAFFLAVKRLVKCHPFNPGGVDELP